MLRAAADLYLFTFPPPSCSGLVCGGWMERGGCPVCAVQGGWMEGVVQGMIVMASSTRTELTPPDRTILSDSRSQGEILSGGASARRGAVIYRTQCHRQASFCHLNESGQKPRGNSSRMVNFPGLRALLRIRVQKGKMDLLWRPKKGSVRRSLCQCGSTCGQG